MKVKRYLAPDMRRALSLIREEMGEDAVILSNRSLDGGVEVVAAALPGDISFSSSGSLGPASAARANSADASGVSNTGQKMQENVSEGKSQESARSYAATPSKPAKDSVVPERVDTQVGDQVQAAVRAAEELRQERERVIQEGREMNRMRSELNGIRRLLEQRLSGMAWEQFSRRTPVQAGVWERLNAMGVPAGLSKSLLDTLKTNMTAAEAWRFAIAGLARQVPVVGTDIAAKGGIFAFLGPTGVGKTTTIGKLATRYVLEHGPESVALVTTDSFRVAAHEQLRTFGRILGVSVRVVDETHSLREILASLRHKSLVLIDTAGLNAKDPSLQFQLQTLRNCPEIQNILVMACTSQSSVLATAYRTYAPAGLSACVLSKLDEAGTIGEALSLVIEQALPVVYETHGQNIPDDIKVAQAHNLVSKAVALSVHSDEESERLMMEFGSVYTDDVSSLDTPAAYPGVARGATR